MMMMMTMIGDHDVVLDDLAHYLLTDEIPAELN